MNLESLSLSSSSSLLGAVTLQELFQTHATLQPPPPPPPFLIEFTFSVKAPIVCLSLHNLAQSVSKETEKHLNVIHLGFFFF